MENAYEGQGSFRDWKTWKMKMVIKNRPKVMEFCESVMESFQFCPQIVLNLYLLVTAKKLSSDLESLHFPKFSTKCREIRIGE